MAEQHEGRHYPDECLAVKSKDRQKEGGARVELKGMDLIMVEDGEEETGERGTNPADLVAYNSP
jgi:hypothetical protein